MKKIIKFAAIGMATLCCAGIAAHETSGPDNEAPRPIESRTGKINKGGAGTSFATDAHLKASGEHSSYVPNLICNMLYAESWNSLPEDVLTPFGFYTFNASEEPRFEEFALIGKARGIANGGACLAGDTYWWIWKQSAPMPDGSEYVVAQLYSMDIKSKSVTAYGQVSDMFVTTAGPAYDPVTESMYGVYKDGTDRYLCKVDYLAEQPITTLGKLNTSYYTVAFDGQGQLWGIDKEGVLNKLDKADGKATPVGNTGVKPSYTQSMAFDYYTGKLYWASYGEGNKSVLYEVSTTDASLTKIVDFTDGQELTGLAVLPPLANDKAPAAPAGLAAEFTEGSKDGKVSFTMPLYTFDGSDLKGSVNYSIKANDQEIRKGMAQAGAKVEKDINLPEGEVALSVVCSNSEGEGVPSVVDLWIGPDYPVEPQNVLFAFDALSGAATVTWDAVTTGRHGGYVDPSAIRYKVVRFPGGDVVAENTDKLSFSETLTEPAEPTLYHYEVTAMNGFRSSEAVATNNIPLGANYDVPFFEQFDTSSAFDFFPTTPSADGSTWQWSRFNNQTAYFFYETDNADAWLFSPGIRMVGGSRYVIRFDRLGLLSNKFNSRLEVKVGKNYDVAAYQSVMEPQVSSSTDTKQIELEFIAPETGIYHIGFHAMSVQKGLSINIDNLFIDLLAADGAPAAVTDLSVETDKGAAPVTIRFKTPTKTYGGGKLDAITKVEVRRTSNNELVKALEITETGKEVKVVDNKGGRGLMEYSVMAFNEEGVGEIAKVSTYLGLDIPGRCRNIALTDNYDGTLQLSWDAPETGIRNGYCDPSNLTYNVYSVENGYAVDYPGGKKLRDNGLRISNVQGYFNNSQNFVIYAVAAENKAGEGSVNASSECVIGKPYTAPFFESWRRGQTDNGLWYRMASGKGTWDFSTDTYDNDGGALVFRGDAEGDMAYYCSGKIDMSRLTQPKLVFYFYCYPGEDLQLHVEINKAYTGNEIARTVDYRNFSSSEAGWQKYVIDMSPYLSLPYIQIRLLGVAGTTVHPNHSDKLSLENSSDPVGIEEISVDGGSVGEIQWFDLQGRRVLNPGPGIYIVRMPDGTTRKVMLN